ncbi:hypothetical protein BDM02DRAFT_3190500 [Thelephora ganbajun]|uniref:Uncharacterized protein n=1 Tax=Thelephora ganbajun TaxID=370292 RepID=A0ACB6Z5X4_THEGA|nr:hypothetical protein BDM02DRAFT_3190500 [Thelephora ganbajun]
MDAKSQRQKGRDGALSELNATTETTHLAKISRITPAKAVFGSVGFLLTMIRGSMANELDYIELGLSCADACIDLDRGMNGRRSDEFSKPVLKAIEQLTTVAAGIKGNIDKWPRTTICEHMTTLTTSDMTQNATFALTESHISYLSTAHPWYYSINPQLWSMMSDFWLSLLGPIIGYWLFCAFFEILDRSDWEWLKKYKIHESSEVTSRNKVTRKQVLTTVISQHVIQFVLGYFWMDTSMVNGGPISVHVPRMEAIAPILLRFLEVLVGRQFAAYVWIHKAQDLVYYVYWWAVPLAQLFAGFVLIDTWQYFLHRGMHTNTFLYKTFHSWHHRLYVPYSYGALYNHPIEGLLLDICGAGISEWLTGMSTRQATLLFTIATFKTVDDHCGYSLPFDPLQRLTSNNADYHDIHHQVIGIKSNFSQPFFVHWDVLLGTRMTRRDVEARKQLKAVETKSL